MAEVRRVLAGHYQIHEKIGQGGMGEVYRGVDTRTGENVAIKALKTEVLEQDPTILERFTREGQALRQLAHPNIVQMIEAVEENGQHYLILEYIGGGTLADALKKESPLPIPRVLQIALDLADALTRAHRLQIIHRDLKPGNILMTEDGKPKLTDFGIARLEREENITKTGTIVGTYSYLSPEAINGEPLDARSDIWSFGILLYEMLTGQRPFDKGREATTLMAILHEPAPDPSSVRPELTPTLSTLILEMLDKDKNQRISSVRRVGTALEEIINSADTAVRNFLSVTPEQMAYQPSRFGTSTNATPMSATPPPTTSSERTPLLEISRITAVEVEAPSKLRRFKPFLYAAGTALILLLIGGIYLLSNGSGDDQVSSPDDTDSDAVILVEPVTAEQDLILVAHFEPLSESEREVSRFIIEDLQTSVEKGAPQLDVVIREYPAIITSEAQASQIMQANDAQAIIWGNYTDQDIDVRVQAGMPPGALFDPEMIRRTTTARLSIHDPRRDTLARYAVTALALYYDQSNTTYIAAEARVIMDTLPISNAAFNGSTVGNYVYDYFLNYYRDRQAAIDAVTEALRLDASNSMLYMMRGALLQQEGDLQQAKQDFESTIRLAPDNWSGPYLILGNNYILQNDLETALTYVNEGIERQPNDWFSRTLRGSIYYLQGDFERAKADFDQAMALEPENNFPYVLASIIALREGRLEDVNQLMETVLTKFPDPAFGNRMVIALTGGGDNPNTFSALSLSAFTNLILGQYNDAIENADAALALSDLPDFYLLKGVAYCNLEEYAEAEAAYTAGIERDPDFIMLYLLRAEVRQKQNNLPGALEDLRVGQASPLWATVEEMMAEAGGSLDCTQFMGGSALRAAPQ